MAIRNPDWTREELILALDLYLMRWGTVVSKDDPEVIKLSKLLNSLPIHADKPNTVTFRNPNGVFMKLGNFSRLDPNYPGEGLARGNRLEENVWDDFRHHPARLKAAVAAIEAMAGKPAPPPLPEAEDEDIGAAEGRLLFKVHRCRERSPGLARRKKDAVLKATGRLRCEVCGFDFVAQYGGSEGPFVECHHRRPLASLRPGQRTTLNDLALVCSNCHRMLHRLSDPSDLGGLRERLKITFAQLLS
jgi:5-methylcytosine-specific restriction enzyme A